jgi:hypothetical protein
VDCFVVSVKGGFLMQSDEIPMLLELGWMLKVSNVARFYSNLSMKDTAVMDSLKLCFIERRPSLNRSNCSV